MKQGLIDNYFPPHALNDNLPSYPPVLHPPGSGSQAAAVSVQTSQNVPSRSGLPHMHSQLEHRPSQRSSSPVGLAKWFGSDVLQQPLPSMPAKVISVDELEYRQ